MAMLARAMMGPCPCGSSRSSCPTGSGAASSARAIIFGLIVNGFTIPGQNDTHVLTALEAIPWRRDRHRDRLLRGRAARLPGARASGRGRATLRTFSDGPRCGSALQVPVVVRRPEMHREWRLPPSRRAMPSCPTAIDRADIARPSGTAPSTALSLSPPGWERLASCHETPAADDPRARRSSGHGRPHHGRSGRDRPGGSAFSSSSKASMAAARLATPSLA